MDKEIKSYYKYRSKINVVFFISKKSYYYNFPRGNWDRINNWIPTNVKAFITFFQNICVLFWLWFNASKRYILVCCDDKRDADIFRELYGIENILYISDINIKHAFVAKLNQQYKRDLYFLHTTILPSLKQGTETSQFNVNVCEDTNIFVALGEYDTITDFELALEAFYVLYTYKIKSPQTRKATYLVILGDEIEFSESQENYFKKLEGFVSKHGLQRNVFFLKIFPYTCKKMILKVALSVIFTNERGCYPKNLVEAIKISKHIIAPNSMYYRRYFRRLGMRNQKFTLANPEDYAREMFKHVKHKMLFRLLARDMPFEIKS